MCTANSVKKLVDEQMKYFSERFFGISEMKDIPSSLLRDLLQVSLLCYCFGYMYTCSRKLRDHRYRKAGSQTRYGQNFERRASLIDKEIHSPILCCRLQLPLAKVPKWVELNPFRSPVVMERVLKRSITWISFVYFLQAHIQSDSHLLDSLTSRRIWTLILV